jgi:hypothetical protein
VLLLPNQRLVSLPNSKVQENGVVNYRRKGHIWSDFSLTVDYGEDLSRVREVITEIAAKDHRILQHPPLAVVVDELGENGVRLLVFPTVRPKDYWDVRNDLREQIKARFDAEGNSIRIAAARRAPCAIIEPAGSDRRRQSVSPLRRISSMKVTFCLGEFPLDRLGRRGRASEGDGNEVQDRYGGIDRETGPWGRFCDQDGD